MSPLINTKINIVGKTMEWILAIETSWLVKSIKLEMLLNKSGWWRSVEWNRSNKSGMKVLIMEAIEAIDIRNNAK